MDNMLYEIGLLNKSIDIVEKGFFDRGVSRSVLRKLGVKRAMFLPKDYVFLPGKSADVLRKEELTKEEQRIQEELSRLGIDPKEKFDTYTSAEEAFPTKTGPEIDKVLELGRQRWDTKREISSMGAVVDAPLEDNIDAHSGIDPSDSEEVKKEKRERYIESIKHRIIRDDNLFNANSLRYRSMESHFPMFSDESKSFYRYASTLKNDEEAEKARTAPADATPAVPKKGIIKRMTDYLDESTKKTLERKGYSEDPRGAFDRRMEELGRQSEEHQRMAPIIAEQRAKEMAINAELAALKNQKKIQKIGKLRAELGLPAPSVPESSSTASTSSYKPLLPVDIEGTTSTGEGKKTRKSMEEEIFKSKPKPEPEDLGFVSDTVKKIYKDYRFLRHISLAAVKRKGFGGIDLSRHLVGDGKMVSHDGMNDGKATLNILIRHQKDLFDSLLNQIYKECSGESAGWREELAMTTGVHEHTRFHTDVSKFNHEIKRGEMFRALSSDVSAASNDPFARMNLFLHSGNPGENYRKLVTWHIYRNVGEKIDRIFDEFRGAGKKNGISRGLANFFRSAVHLSSGLGVHMVPDLSDFEFGRIKQDLKDRMKSYNEEVVARQARDWFLYHPKTKGPHELIDPYAEESQQEHIKRIADDFSLSPITGIAIAPSSQWKSAHRSPAFVSMTGGYGVREFIDEIKQRGITISTEDEEKISRAFEPEIIDSQKKDEKSIKSMKLGGDDIYGKNLCDLVDVSKGLFSSAMGKISALRRKNFASAPSFSLNPFYLSAKNELNQEIAYGTDKMKRRQIAYLKELEGRTQQKQNALLHNVHLANTASFIPSYVMGKMAEAQEKELSGFNNALAEQKHLTGTISSDIQRDVPLLGRRGFGNV